MKQFNKKFLNGVHSFSALTLSTVLSGAVALGGLSSAEALGFGGVIQGKHSQTYDLSLDSKANSIDVKVPKSYRAKVTMEMHSSAGTQSKQMTLEGGQTHTIQGPPNSQVSLKVDFEPLSSGGYAAGVYRIEVADSAIAGGSSEKVGTSQQVAVTPPPIFNKSPKDSSLAPTPPPPTNRSQPTPPKTTPGSEQEQQTSARGKSLSYDSLYQTSTAVILGPGPVNLDTSKWPSRYYGYLRFDEAGPVPAGEKKEFCDLSINYPAEERWLDGGYAGEKYGPVCNFERPVKGVIEMTIFDRSLPRRECRGACKQYLPERVKTRPGYAGPDARNNTPVVIHNASFWPEGYRRMSGTIFPVRRRGQGGF